MVDANRPSLTMAAPKPLITSTVEVIAPSHSVGICVVKAAVMGWLPH
jgi:hypothetical protein